MVQCHVTPLIEIVWNAFIVGNFVIILKMFPLTWETFKKSLVKALMLLEVRGSKKYLLLVD